MQFTLEANQGNLEPLLTLEFFSSSLNVLNFVTYQIKTHIHFHLS